MASPSRRARGAEIPQQSMDDPSKASIKPAGLTVRSAMENIPPSLVNQQTRGIQSGKQSPSKPANPVSSAATRPTSTTSSAPASTVPASRAPLAARPAPVASAPSATVSVRPAATAAVAPAPARPLTSTTAAAPTRRASLGAATVPASMSDIRSPKAHLAGLMADEVTAPTDATGPVPMSTGRDSLGGAEGSMEIDTVTDTKHSKRPPAAEEARMRHLEGLIGPLHEYADDIYVDLKQNELKYRPRADYIESVQKDINNTMRGILIDWLVEVAEEYKLTTQTFFLTVSYIDRLLSIVSVHRTKLQLIGITCMLLASKYEEIYPPSVDDFVYIADNTYTRDEVLRMETVLLNTLQFSLTNVTTWEFTRRYCKLSGIDAKTTQLVHYLTELLLPEPEVLRFLPSHIAAASVYVALASSGQKPWTPEFEEICGFPVSEITECIQVVFDNFVKTAKGKSTLKAVRVKYAEEKRFKVSAMSPPEKLDVPRS